jgi:hypothetical protein
MSKLVSGVALGLFLAPVACASAASPAKAPPQPPALPVAASTAVAANTVASLPPLPPATPAAASPMTTAAPASAPAAPLPATSAASASAALPQLPSSAATIAPPAAPPAPPTVNIADERPFVGAAPARTTTAQPSTSTTPTTRTRRGHHSSSTSTSPAPPPSSSSAPSASHRHRTGHDQHAPAHPEPRIVIEVTAVQGGVQQAEVQRAARARGWGLVRSCYAEGLRRNQRLAGHFGFDFTIGADGAVASSDRKPTTFADESVVGCVARELAHLSLFKPENANASVAFQVTLSPGDEQIPVPHLARNTDKLREDLRARWSGVEVCYREGLDHREDLGGRLELRFRVRPSGEVADVAEGDTHFADADVTHCIVELYKNTQFHRLGGRQDETFAYALHLEPLPPLAPRPPREPAHEGHDNDDAHDTRNEH